MFNFYFDIDPRPKGRPRTRVIGGGKKAFATIYTPAETIAYEDAIRKDAVLQWQKEPLAADVPVGVDIWFSMPRPGLIRRGGPSFLWHLKTPDVDNLAKSVMDALQPQILSDDKNVVALKAAKCYCREDLPVGVYVKITLLGDLDGNGVSSELGLSGSIQRSRDPEAGDPLADSSTEASNPRARKPRSGAGKRAKKTDGSEGVQ